MQPRQLVMSFKLLNGGILPVLTILWSTSPRKKERQQRHKNVKYTYQKHYAKSKLCALH